MKEETMKDSDSAVKISDLLSSNEDNIEDEELFKLLVGEDGKLKVDMGMPDGFMVDIMASQMVEHMVSYEQSRQIWRSLRNQGNHAKAAQAFEQMQHNQLTIAIIQAKHPQAKAIANQLMEVRAKQADTARKNALVN